MNHLKSKFLILYATPILNQEVYTYIVYQKRQA